MRTLKPALLLLLLATCSMIISPAHSSTEVLVWDTKPLKIRLEISKERIIVFPDNVEITMPAQLHRNVNIASTAGKVYVTPNKPFPESRIEVALVSTNERVLIDLFAVSPTDDNELGIVKVVTNQENILKEQTESELFEQTKNITIKELIQHASHDLYAPARLKQTNRPIRESEIHKPLDLALLFMGRSADLFDIQPLKQYQTTNHTLTAILLTNRTPTQQMLVYRDMYPNFEAVSSQHKNVGPKGGLDESTVMYLVTKHPLYDDPIYAK